MSRYSHKHETEHLLAAAQRWKETCLLQDGSLLFSDRTLWTFSNLEELNRRFTQNPIEGGDSYVHKLSLQLADRISDAILDRCLEIEPMARVAIETLVAPHLVVVAGEIAFPTELRHDQVLEEIPSIVRCVLLDTGYSETFPGIDPDECETLVRVNHQSPEIARAVEYDDGEYGAGNQGLMFGHACDETSTLMPLPIHLAHQLMMRHRELRKSRTLRWLRPDAKAQVTVRYVDDQPVSVETVVLSTSTRAV